jgi:phosphoribosylformylglycinamidine synthase|tara:strand:+ start:102 stop:353 length:252 start_codon:yes stop_codon:yes gene_type:complete
MKFKAEIDIMPLKSLLDPQGKAVSASMKNIDLSEIDNVRIGKHITLDIEAEDHESAKQKVDTACKKMLCNQIMESYSFKLAQY